MSPREKENTERISTFLPKDAVEYLKEESKAKGLTVSSLIRMVVLEYVGIQKSKK